MSHVEKPPLGAARRRAAVTILALVALLLGLAVAAEVLVEPPTAPAAEPVAVPPPNAGTWYCPVTAGEGEAAVVAIAATGDEASTVRVLHHLPGGVAADEPIAVPPGGVADVVLEGSEAMAPVSVRWSGGPVVTAWRVEGTDTAGARCETAPAPSWHLTGFETTAQSQSRIHLFNPFSVDAVARVTFGTPTGPVRRVLTDNILVTAGSLFILDVNEFEPEQPDLAATVEVLAGRIVVQGTVSLSPTANQPGPTGRDVVRGATAGAVEWASAYGRADGGSSSWLSVYNPNDREAAVEVRVANPLPDSPALLGEQSVPAGGVVRIDLAESSASTEFGVLLIGVNEVPVVVTRLTTARTGAGAEGLAVSLGDRPALRWAAAGAGTGQRQSRVALYNPGAEAVTLALDAGAGTPPEWAAITLQPNEHTTRELADVDEDLGAIPVRVTSDGPVVMDVRVQSPAEGLRFWTVGGVAAAVWEGSGERPAVRRDARLSTRPAAVETPDPAIDL